MFLWWLLDMREFENAFVWFHCLVTGLGVFALCCPTIPPCVTRLHADNGMRGTCLPSRKCPCNFIRPARRRAYRRDAFSRSGVKADFGIQGRRVAHARPFFRVAKCFKSTQSKWECRHRDNKPCGQRRRCAKRSALAAMAHCDRRRAIDSGSRWRKCSQWSTLEGDSTGSNTSEAYIYLRHTTERILAATYYSNAVYGIYITIFIAQVAKNGWIGAKTMIYRKAVMPIIAGVSLYWYDT